VPFKHVLVSSLGDCEGLVPCPLLATPLWPRLFTHATRANF